MNKLKLQLLIAEAMSFAIIMFLYFGSNVGIAFCISKLFDLSFLAIFFIEQIVLCAGYLFYNSFKTLRAQFRIVNALANKSIPVDLAHEPAEELTPVQRPPMPGVN